MSPTLPQAILRDYTLIIHDENGKAPLLSVFGAFSSRPANKLAEHAMEKLASYYPIGGMDQNVRTARRRHRRHAKIRGGTVVVTILTESLARHYSRTRQQHAGGFSAKPRRCLLI